VPIALSLGARKDEKSSTSPMRRRFWHQGAVSACLNEVLLLAQLELTDLHRWEERPKSGSYRAHPGLYLSVSAGRPRSRLLSNALRT
jgi:hypothetical protein